MVSLFAVKVNPHAGFSSTNSCSGLAREKSYLSNHPGRGTEPVTPFLTGIVVAIYLSRLLFLSTQIMLFTRGHTSFSNKNSPNSFADFAVGSKAKAPADVATF